VIFTTAYDEHAVEAFELHAVDYLLKPFSQERFVEAVQHALQSARRADAALPALAAASAGRSRAADPGAGARRRQDLPADGRRDRVPALRHQVHRDRQPGAQPPGAPAALGVRKRLKPDRFLKINRACIVNLDFVVAMVPGENSQLEVQMKDGTRVTASREVSRQLRADSL
jgi:two-component system LytT family response regulator